MLHYISLPYILDYKTRKFPQSLFDPSPFVLSTRYTYILEFCWNLSAIKPNRNERYQEKVTSKAKISYFTEYYYGCNHIECHNYDNNSKFEQFSSNKLINTDKIDKTFYEILFHENISLGVISCYLGCVRFTDKAIDRHASSTRMTIPQTSGKCDASLMCLELMSSKSNVPWVGQCTHPRALAAIAIQSTISGTQQNVFWWGELRRQNAIYIQDLQGKRV